MSSRDDLAQLVSAISHPIDIVIDDGSHASHHQQIALGRLFPQVRSRGIYVIEDLHWQDEELERKEAPKTRDILRRLQIEGTFESPFLSKEEQKYVQTNVDTLWLFDSLATNIEDTSDALAVLLKK